MRARIRKVLAVGLAHGHLDIVLGAWGCGAFGNDPELIAKLFGDALRGPFAGCYRRVIFAVTDWSSEQRFIDRSRRSLAQRWEVTPANGTPRTRVSRIAPPASQR